MCRRNGSELSPNLRGHGFELSIRRNLQSSAKGFLISSLVAWQRFVDVKQHYVASIYCFNCFFKHLYKMIKMQCKVDSENW